MRERIVRGVLALVACAVLLASGGAALAGSKDVTLHCHKNGRGTRLGGVDVTFSWGVPKDSKAPARECNEKYLNDCNGQCWGCSHFSDTGGIADCYDTQGKCHGICGSM